MVAKTTKKKTKLKQLEKLSEDHLHFCRALVASKKMNQTQSYIDTMAAPGMKRVKAKERAGKLMKHKLIRIEIARLIDRRNTRLDMDADKVLAEISSIAFMKFGDFAEYDDDGNVTLKPSKDIDTRGIKSIKRRIVSTNEDSVTEAFEFKLHDKIKALELAMRHLGLLSENLINVGKVEVKVQLPPELTEDLIN